MGESDSCPAVGVAKENPLRLPIEGQQRGVGGRGIVRADEPVPSWEWRER